MRNEPMRSRCDEKCGSRLQDTATDCARHSIEHWGPTARWSPFSDGFREDHSIRTSHKCFGAAKIFANVRMNFWTITTSKLSSWSRLVRMLIDLAPIGRTTKHGLLHPDDEVRRTPSYDGRLTYPRAFPDERRSAKPRGAKIRDLHQFLAGEDPG